ncbi:mucin-4 isoform X2 [Hyalella azteca]|uniref:Mucin-4 isoform X2 n=1 Tax=Hyalella azteca TaxID=294128 RepID=A0A979FN82_HYAAZ|nr:mucin-4 isoform X2 [Hyalella azteca]
MPIVTKMRADRPNAAAHKPTRSTKLVQKTILVLPEQSRVKRSVKPDRRSDVVPSKVSTRKSNGAVLVTESLPKTNRRFFRKNDTLPVKMESKILKRNAMSFSAKTDGATTDTAAPLRRSSRQAVRERRVWARSSRQTGGSSSPDAIPKTASELIVRKSLIPHKNRGRPPTTKRSEIKAIDSSAKTEMTKLKKVNCRCPVKSRISARCRKCSRREPSMSNGKAEVIPNITQSQKSNIDINSIESPNDEFEESDQDRPAMNIEPVSNKEVVNDISEFASSNDDTDCVENGKEDLKTHLNNPEYSNFSSMCNMPRPEGNQLDVMETSRILRESLQTPSFLTNSFSPVSSLLANPSLSGLARSKLSPGVSISLSSSNHSKLRNSITNKMIVSSYYKKKRSLLLPNRLKNITSQQRDSKFQVDGKNKTALISQTGKTLLGERVQTLVTATSSLVIDSGHLSKPKVMSSRERERRADAASSLLRKFRLHTSKMKSAVKKNIPAVKNLKAASEEEDNKKSEPDPSKEVNVKPIIPSVDVCGKHEEKSLVNSDCSKEKFDGSLKKCDNSPLKQCKEESKLCESGVGLTAPVNYIPELPISSTISKLKARMLSHSNTGNAMLQHSMEIKSNKPTHSPLKEGKHSPKEKLSATHSIAGKASSKSTAGANSSVESKGNNCRKQEMLSASTHNAEPASSVNDECLSAGKGWDIKSATESASLEMDEVTFPSTEGRVPLMAALEQLVQHGDVPEAEDSQILTIHSADNLHEVPIKSNANLHPMPVTSSFNLHQDSVTINDAGSAKSNKENTVCKVESYNETSIDCVASSTEQKKNQDFSAATMDILNAGRSMAEKEFLLPQPGFADAAPGEVVDVSYDDLPPGGAKRPPLMRPTARPLGIKTPLKCCECPMQFCTVRSLFWHFGTHFGARPGPRVNILLGDLVAPWPKGGPSIAPSTSTSELPDSRAGTTAVNMVPLPKSVVSEAEKSNVKGKYDGSYCSAGNAGESQCSNASLTNLSSMHGKKRKISSLHKGKSVSSDAISQIQKKKSKSCVVRDVSRKKKAMKIDQVTQRCSQVIPHNTPLAATSSGIVATIVGNHMVESTYHNPEVPSFNTFNSKNYSFISNSAKPRVKDLLKVPIPRLKKSLSLKFPSSEPKSRFVSILPKASLEGVNSSPENSTSRQASYQGSESPSAQPSLGLQKGKVKPIPIPVNASHKEPTKHQALQDVRRNRRKKFVSSNEPMQQMEESVVMINPNLGLRILSKSDAGALSSLNSPSSSDASSSFRGSRFSPNPHNSLTIVPQVGDFTLKSKSSSPPTPDILTIVPQMNPAKHSFNDTRDVTKQASILTAAGALSPSRAMKLVLAQRTSAPPPHPSHAINFKDRSGDVDSDEEIMVIDEKPEDELKIDPTSMCTVAIEEDTNAAQLSCNSSPEKNSDSEQEIIDVTTVDDNPDTLTLSPISKPINYSRCSYGPLSPDASPSGSTASHHKSLVGNYQSGGKSPAIWSIEAPLPSTTYNQLTISSYQSSSNVGSSSLSSVSITKTSFKSTLPASLPLLLQSPASPITYPPVSSVLSSPKSSALQSPGSSFLSNHLTSLQKSPISFAHQPDSRSLVPLPHVPSFSLPLVAPTAILPPLSTSGIVSLSSSPALHLTKSSYASNPLLSVSPQGGQGSRNSIILPSTMPTTAITSNVNTLSVPSLLPLNLATISSAPASGAAAGNVKPLRTYTPMSIPSFKKVSVPSFTSVTVPSVPTLSSLSIAPTAPLLASTTTSPASLQSFLLAAPSSVAALPLNCSRLHDALSSGAFSTAKTTPDSKRASIPSLTPINLTTQSSLHLSTSVTQHSGGDGIQNKDSPVYQSDVSTSLSGDDIITKSKPYVTLVNPSLSDDESAKSKSDITQRTTPAGESRLQRLSVVGRFSSTKQRKYVCPHCDRRFGWSTDLKRHVIIHTGERPFKCQVCSHAFTRKFLLQNHVKRLHSKS